MIRQLSPHAPSVATSIVEGYEPTNVSTFPIIAIGGSAGALAAFEAFFVNMPVDLGVAYVIIQHLAPASDSMLVELIARNTKIPVLLVTHDLKVMLDHIYVIPPGMELIIVEGRLKLLKKNKPKAVGLYCVDIFFKSLAVYSKEKAIGIVVSGMGTDGTIGIRALKENNALVIVQEPENATYEGMPRSAIATGLPDFVLPVEDMPEQVIHYVKHNFIKKPIVNLSSAKSKEMVMQKIMNSILLRTGHDFSFYKSNTILRRIERRILLLQLDDLLDYSRYIENNPKEVNVLFQELLIGVTNFFRDSETFDEILHYTLPKILENKVNGELRVWIPACSTGEEAYTWAIIIIEALETAGKTNQIKIQIFGTDIDQEAIHKARLGNYPLSIAEFITPERLDRFFVKKDDTYQISKDIREMVIFAPQSLIKDAPFTKLDILSCRNFLIYITAELQRKLIMLFHYALKPDGALLLGSAETISGFSDLYTPISLKHRLYARSKSSSNYAGTLNFPLSFGKAGAVKSSNKVSDYNNTLKLIPKKVQKTLLENYAPPSIVINKEGEIFYINGSAGKYLEILPGPPSMNVFKMAKDGLKFEIEKAVRTVFSSQEKLYEIKLQVLTEIGYKPIHLTLRPFKEKEMNGLLLISIEEIEKQNPEEVNGGAAEPLNVNVEDLKRELKITKIQLQDTIQDMEASVEELTSTNEEVQSTNEELQSANEELTTSKEELQSLNEELVTVNAELNAKMDEFLQVNNDIKNLLEATETCTIFLDNALNIKRFSPLAKRLFKLIASDIGRPITDIVSSIDHPKMVDDLQLVLETLIPLKKEIYTIQKEIFEMRIVPYRTIDNYIGGVLITFAHIIAYKQLQEKINSLRVVEEITKYIYEGIILLDENLEIVFSNKKIADIFNVDGLELLGKSIYSIADNYFDTPEIKQFMYETSRHNIDVSNFLLPVFDKKEGQQELTLSVKLLSIGENNFSRLLLLIKSQQKSNSDSPYEQRAKSKG